MRQEEQESIEEFADRVYALTLDAYPHVPDDVMQALAIDLFFSVVVRTSKQPC